MGKKKKICSGYGLAGMEMREARWERSDTRVGVCSALISPGDDRRFMRTKLPKTADAFNIVRRKLTPANAFFASSFPLIFIHIFINCFFPRSDVTFPSFSSQFSQRLYVNYLFGC